MFARFGKPKGEIGIRTKLAAAFPGAQLGRSAIIAPAYGVTYINNPKCGCSTLKLIMYRAHLNDPAYDPPNVHTVHVTPKPREHGWPETSRLLTGGGYVFTFVRDPVARAISAYSDKVVRQRRTYAPQVQTALGRAADPDDPVSFEDFVAALERTPPLEMNPHWRPQFHNTFQGVVRYDRIGRLENFAPDMALVAEESGLPLHPVQRRNAKPRRVEGEISASLRRRLEAVYAVDFETFRY